MPHGAAKLGNKYRRNIYKIVQRTGRKLKLVAQFDNLETITLHVKNDLSLIHISEPTRLLSISYAVRLIVFGPSGVSML